MFLAEMRRRLPVLARGAENGSKAARRLSGAPRLGELRLGLTSTIVLLVALAGTAAAYVALRQNAERSEERLLRKRSQELTDVFHASIGQTQAILDASAAVADATGGDPGSFAAVMEERVRKSALSSVALVRVTGDDPVVIAQVGRQGVLLLDDLSQVDTQKLHEIARTGQLRVVKTTLLRATRVIGFATSPHPRSAYSIYAEVVLPDVSRSHTWSDLSYAFYLGEHESPDRLLASNERHLPLRGRRVTEVFRIGAEKALLVIAPRPLGGPLSIVPLLVLAFGASGALTLAALFEMHRRRNTALRWVDDLALINAELDRAVSAHREIEQQLRTSEERYRLLVEQSPDMIAVHRDGLIVFVNQTGQRLLAAQTPEELLAKPVLDIVHPAFRGLASERISKIMRERTAVPFIEMQFLRLDGATIDVEVAGFPTAFEGKSASQFIVRDIAERKRAERERADLEEQLRQSQKMEAIGQLVGGITHDFNNLLTVIGGYSQMLVKALRRDDSLREAAEEIAKAADHASGLTRQLLTFSRKHVGTQMIVDLNAVVRDMEKMLGRLIGEDIEFATVLGHELAPVKIDLAQLEQVIVNLVVNARDVMPNGGTLAIETSSIVLDRVSARHHFGLEPGPYVVLSVSDNGVGMDGETLSRIFEPFFTTKELGQGTGLGLSTVYGVVSQCGGRVSVDSEIGEGTTFRIYFPKASEPLEEREWAGSPTGGDGTETVLLVEDNEHVRGFACKALLKSSYKTIAVPSPREALAFARSYGKPIHLLVTDVVMPEMSGRSLAKAVLAERPDMRVLYMSGYTADTLQRETPDDDIAFLGKPFGPDELIRKVREVLDAPRARVAATAG